MLFDRSSFLSSRAPLPHTHRHIANMAEPNEMTATVPEDTPTGDSATQPADYHDLRSSGRIPPAPTPGIEFDPPPFLSELKGMSAQTFEQNKFDHAAAEHVKVQEEKQKEMALKQLTDLEKEYATAATSGQVDMRSRTGVVFKTKPKDKPHNKQQT